ncbi:MAG: peptidase S10 [Planctomycetota bacterium]
MPRSHLPLTASLFLLLGVAPAQDDPQKAKPETPARRFVTEHSATIGGRKLDYVVTAGETFLRDDKGAPRASFFTFAYTEKGADAAHRPVTFAFNGGPGSSSIWLHLGLLGPERARVPSDATSAGSPPYVLEANPDSILDGSDIVFVDPIGTGFSEARGDAKGEDYWGFDEDAGSVAEFIRRWLTENQRWTSPKYVLGESYGGIRSGLLLRELQGGSASVGLSGVMMISPALDMEFVDGSGSDMQTVLSLPTMAAAAAYHHALPEQPEDLEAFLREAREFARGEYLGALFAGASLAPDRMTAIIQKLHRFTGLKDDYIRDTNLRISTARFRRELLRDRGLVLGRLDARYTGTEADDAGETPTSDPMNTAVGAAYAATFHDYLGRELGVSMDRDYLVSSPVAGGRWKRSGRIGGAFAGWLDVMPDVARAMAANPKLRILIANGLYDTATTFFAAEYNASRFGIDQSRVTLREYPAGHMMYLHEPSLHALAIDLRGFLGH